MNGVTIANQEEAALIAAEFLYSLDNLPNEVQHLLLEIKTKDTKASEIQAEINKDTARYIRHAVKPSQKDAAGASSSGGGTPTPNTAGAPPNTAGSSAPPTTAASTTTTASSGKESKDAKDALIPQRVAENYALLDALHLERIALAQRLVDTLARTSARLEHDLGRVVQLSGENIPQETYVVQGGYVVGTIPAAGAGAATASSAGANISATAVAAAAANSAVGAVSGATAGMTSLPQAVSAGMSIPAQAPPSSAAAAAAMAAAQGGGMHVHAGQVGHGLSGMQLGAGGTLPLGPPAQLAAMVAMSQSLRGGGPVVKAVENLREATGASISEGPPSKRRKVGTGASSRAHTPQARGSRLAQSSSARASPHPPSSAQASHGTAATGGSAYSRRRAAAAARKGAMISDDDVENNDGEEDADGEGEEDEEGEGDSEDQKLYCLCQRTSYGEMIACDNQKCPYQWFHLGCVGLSGKPLPDIWVCEECLRTGARGASTAASASAGGNEGGGGGGGGRKARRKV